MPDDTKSSEKIVSSTLDFKGCFLILSFLASLLTFTLKAQAPQPPTLISVSVDSMCRTVITWGKSTSANVSYYVVLADRLPFDTGKGSVKIDSTANTVYLDSKDAVCKQAMRFNIIAVDTSSKRYNPSEATGSFETIYLQEKYDSCKNQITLNWNQPYGWSSKIKSYNIWYADSGSNTYKLLVSNLVNTAIAHTVENIKENTQYDFYIEAVRNDGVSSSTSNIVRKYTAMLRAPQFIDANATMLSNNQVDLTFNIDPSSQLTHYEIFKADLNSGSYEVLADTVNFTAHTLQYTDYIASGQKLKYKLVALNTCQNIEASSNLASNVLLKVENEQFTNNLSWNKYIDWRGGVASYNIYRQIGNAQPAFIGSTDSMMTEYSDDLAFLKNKNISDHFCYYIVAVEGDSTKYGHMESKSNEVCIYVKPLARVPNAIIPNADPPNNEFKPFLTFLPEKYIMTIYNRYGGKIFETTNPLEGWNGRIKGGELAKEGVYMYYIKISSEGNKPAEYSGTVAVVYK
ncbi:MAG: gliding motility-associated C-terminal domain-containing protein [Bacteroidota bacterium]|nr:gliding motility-associated C-terminal domain-containing protein [Bacteroidota bacterium]